MFKKLKEALKGWLAMAGIGIIMAAGGKLLASLEQLLRDFASGKLSEKPSVKGGAEKAADAIEKVRTKAEKGAEKMKRPGKKAKGAKVDTGAKAPKEGSARSESKPESTDEE